MPVHVLIDADDRRGGTTLGNALADAAYIGFYYMLRAGEYLDTGTGEERPILLHQITFTDNAGRSHSAVGSPVTDIVRSSYATITFVDQKNGHKGQAVVHHTSGHPRCCPVRALQRRVLALRLRAAPGDTPVTAVYDDATWTMPTSTQLTSFLRHALRPHHHIPYSKPDISPRSLRSGGAMALLLAGVDKTVIQLVGRWTSDAIFSYLHSTALPLIKNHASKMLRHGKFTIVNATLSLPEATTVLDDNFIHDDDDSS